MDTSVTEILQGIVQKITNYLSVPCEITIDADDADAPIAVSIQTPESAKFLIGKNGQNLNALEHVVRIAWMRASGGVRSVTIDVNDYRKTKTNQLIELVRHTANRVRDTHNSEALEPMSSYERRIVHTELAAHSDLASESVGQDPNRRVVIRLL